MKRRKRMLDDLDADIRDHLDCEIQDNLDRGMSPEEARRAAFLKFGNVARVKEDTRAVWITVWAEQLLQDIRYALRTLRKSPGFTLVAVLTLALGIGANTAIFSAVNGILLKPLPYADASRLVSIMGYKSFPGGLIGSMDFSPDVWRQVQSQTPAIERMALYQNQRDLTLTGEAVPEIVPGVKVSGDFFSLLGDPPLLGRPILESDTRVGAKPVAVLSETLWRSTFGSDPAVIGRRIDLGGKAYSVIGVMPQDFQFPLYATSKGVWLPLIVPPAQESKDAAAAMAVVRLKPGETIAAVNAELKTVSGRLSSDFNNTFAEGGYFLATGLKPQFGDLDNALLILLGAVGFVLLIACVNVSSLSLARGWARQREIAVREALGAGRSRIVRQFLTESTLLALLGGALGLLLSFWAVHVLRAITPPGAPEHGHFRLDMNVLWFTLAVSVLSGILFGSAPAVQNSRRKLGATMKGSLGQSSGCSASTRSRKLQDFLAAAEIALALILVIGATLAARSFERLMAIRLGFHTDRLLTMKVNFSNTICGGAKTLGACRLAAQSAVDNIRDIPGVQSAAVSSTVPLETWSVAANLHIEGQAEELSLGGGALITDRIVSPGYFRTMGIALLSGRGFLPTDTASAVHVAIVDATFAQKYLGNQPLGRRISYKLDRQGHPEWMQIVGVVSNARDFRPRESPRPEVYVPFGQAPYFQATNFMVRTASDPMVVAPAIQRAIWGVDKNAPITDLATMNQIVQDAFSSSRFQTILLGAFGALGLLMAAIGIYGVISYMVAQRTHEIGIRVALGAQRSDVLREVIGEGAVLAGIGIVAGVIGALALTRLLRSLLFQIKPSDPVTFASAVVVLLAVALAACYIPVRRAMRVDPMTALRHE